MEIKNETPIIDEFFEKYNVCVDGLDITVITNFITDIITMYPEDKIE